MCLLIVLELVDTVDSMERPKKNGLIKRSALESILITRHIIITRITGNIESPRYITYYFIPLTCVKNYNSAHLRKYAHYIAFILAFSRNSRGAALIVASCELVAVHSPACPARFIAANSRISLVGDPVGAESRGAGITIVAGNRASDLGLFGG